MACTKCNNQGNPKTVVEPVSSESLNNMGYEENFLGHNHERHPEEPIFHFTVNKTPAANLNEAMQLIYRKRPPLKLGEPAAVQYYDKDIEGNDIVSLLFCIGGANRKEAKMFMVTSNAGGSDDHVTREEFEELAQKVEIIDGQVVEVEASVEELQEASKLFTEKISALNQKVNTINNEISDINNDIDNVNTRVDNTNARVDNTNARVDTINDKVCTVISDISTINNTISDIKEEMKEVEASLVWNEEE